MEPAAKILYGSFPRTVAAASNGELRQFYVHSESEFDLFFDTSRPKKNLYSSICRFRSDMRPVLDKIVFDFDSPMKEAAFREEITEGEKVDIMREDDDMLYEVLGDVWSDVQSLVSECQEQEIPVLSVLSGFGFHCHMLYQEEVNPTEQFSTTVRYFADICDLDTWDRQIAGDTRRILRVPNAQRMEMVNGDPMPTGVWNIPLTEKEVLHNELEDVFARASEPKNISNTDQYSTEIRPEMETKEGYDAVDEEQMVTEELEARNIDIEVEEDAKMIVDMFMEMPCMKERALRSNPPHLVRFNFAVNMFNAGWEPEEVLDVIRGLNWVDFDEKTTLKILRQIYKRGYSDVSCEKLMQKGYCVYGPEFEEYSDDPKDCSTYKWSGGQCEWK